jgi:hypothetical protein
MGSNLCLWWAAGDDHVDLDNHNLENHNHDYDHDIADHHVDDYYDDDTSNWRFLLRSSCLGVVGRVYWWTTSYLRRPPLDGEMVCGIAQPGFE